MSETGTPDRPASAGPDKEEPSLGRPIRIGDLRLETNLLLAPMAGLTDKIFRHLIRRDGDCGLAITEMVSSEALTRDNLSAREIMDLEMDIHPVGVQIYGTDPARMAVAASMARDAGADVVDINMGCPAAKIVRNGSGSALMRDSEQVAQIVRGVVKAAGVPVTAKLRLGWNAKEINVLDIAAICQDEGASAITVHCRTRKDGFRRGVRWDLLRETTETLRIPVFVNGDINTPEEAVQAMEVSGAGGVMIGRGSLRCPWLFRLAREPDRTAEVPLAVRKEFILEHFRLMNEVYRERPVMILHMMRVFAGWYTRGLMHGAKLRKKINDTKEPEAFIAAIQAYFAEAEGGLLENTG